MIVDVQGDEPPDISPACYFAGLQAAASYVIDNGLPFFASGHISFMRDYLKAWRTKSGDEAVREASADLAKLEEKTQHRLHPVLVQMGGLFRAVFSSSWMVLAKSIRIVPPLITAVVVVFVTSDAWRLPWHRLYPSHYMPGGPVSRHESGFPDQIQGLLGGRASGYLDIQGHSGGLVDGHMQRNGARAGSRSRRPMAALPQTHGAGRQDRAACEPCQSWGPGMLLYGGYLVVSAFSLVVVALVVSASLILVALILISAKETSALAGQSARIWLMLPGHLVITRELVSLSVCLGAFAVFFLVAGQRTEDRKEFMDNVLADVRRIFVVYSCLLSRPRSCREVDQDPGRFASSRPRGSRQRRNHTPGVHSRG